jgi:lactam utilization protein B
MAKFELKFLDRIDNCWIQVKELDGIISIFACDERQTNTSGVCIHLDKSTAIKFSKTLRTEINEITESEDYNG